MATRKYTHNTEIECTPPPFILSYYLLAPKGGGGIATILYSQHATKIGSHHGQGEEDYYQTSQTLACVAQF